MSPSVLKNFEWFFRNMFEEDFGPELTAFIAIYTAVILIVVAVGLIFSAAIYIMNGISLMKMGKKCGVAHPWLSWIPYANSYVFGKIAETPDKPRRTGLLLLILNIAQSVSALILVGSTAGLVSSIGRLSHGASESLLLLPSFLLLFSYAVILGVSITFSVFYYMAFYRICKLFGGTQYMTYFLLGFIPVFLGLGISLPIAMLVLSSREPSAANFQPKTPDQIWRTPTPQAQPAPAPAPAPEAAPVLPEAPAADGGEAVSSEEPKE